MRVIVNEFKPIMVKKINIIDQFNILSFLKFGPEPPPPKTKRELIKEKLDQVWPQW